MSSPWRHGACFLSVFRGGELDEKVRQTHAQRKRLRGVAPLEGIRKAAGDLESVSTRQLLAKISSVKGRKGLAVLLQSVRPLVVGGVWCAFRRGVPRIPRVGG